jgi:hypothetical protein
MSLRHHEIAETYHRILNPLLAEDLVTLAEAADLQPGMSVLDLCSGKGEMLCQWARSCGVTGVGVDFSQVFVAAARSRALELGVSEAVSFLEAEAAEQSRVLARERPSSFDVVACLGATWIGGGLAGTVELMRPLVRPGGTLLVGEPFYEEPPPEAAFPAWGFAADSYTSLAGTLDRLEGLGLDLVEMVAADARGWERYEASRWKALARWLEDHPDDPEREALARFLANDRRAYMAWGRRYLGWAVFVTRPRG